MPKSTAIQLKAENNRASRFVYLAWLMVLTIAFIVGMQAFASAEEVGEVGVDWLGNDIIIEAVKDPDVEGVTCHLAYFERGLVDRLQKGNWFEDPSNASIACRQTGAITIGDIERGKGGEEIFRNRRSLIFKKLVVKRVYDEANNTLIYISHAREIQDGSAKMSISTVPLFDVRPVNDY
jgi:CreA protein